MKGDYSRLTPREKLKAKHFSAVLSQQGRVLLDSEQNSAEDIEAYLHETSLTDIIGPSGVPLNDSHAFEISGVTSSNFSIAPGHMYVEGLLVESDGATTFSTQPFVAAAGEAVSPPAGTRTDLVYLEAWQQHVTALEDPDIREPALNIPDTTTRLRTLWRVHIQQNVAAVDCDDPIAGFPPPADGARLTNSTAIGALPTDPCVTAPDGGYRLLENRLMRVEVHKGSAAVGGPTAKWSTENGAVAYGITSVNPVTIVVGGVGQPGLRITLRQQGRDQFLSLQVNDLVEIVSGADEIRGNPGVLGKVSQRISPTVYDVLLNAGEVVPPEYIATPLPASLYDASRTDIKVRRWDGLIPDLTVATTLGNTGVSVSFPAVANARTGDYWTFAGRTANVASAAESLEPVTNALPHGIRRHYARLALIQWNGAAATVVDCRPLFPPLTDMVELHFVGGDGQELCPGQGQPLDPLIVRVSNGGIPLPNVEVDFVPDPNSGTVTPIPPGPLPMRTDAQGLARVNWSLDPNTVRQRVTASLVAKPELQVVFHANLSVASEVCYRPGPGCAMPDTVETVKDALDFLCTKPGGTGGLCTITVGDGVISKGDFNGPDALRNALFAARDQGGGTICLLRGVHELRDNVVVDNARNIVVEGNKLEAVVHCRGFMPLQFSKCFGIELHDVRFLVEEPFSEVEGDGILRFVECSGVVIENCLIDVIAREAQDSRPIALLLMTGSLVGDDPALTPPFVTSVPLPGGGGRLQMLNPARALVRNCQFTVTGAGPFHGIALQQVRAAWLIENLVQIFCNRGGYGIMLQDDSDACWVYRNKIMGGPDAEANDAAPRGGIRLASGCDEVTLQANEILGGGGFGIELCSVNPNGASEGGLRGAQILDNRIERMALNGIGIVPFVQGQGDGEPRTDDLVIRGNRIESCAYGAVQPIGGGAALLPLAGGIALWRGLDVTIEDNQVEDNGRVTLADGNERNADQPVGGIVFMFPEADLNISRNRVRNNFSERNDDPAAPAVSRDSLFVSLVSGAGTATIADNEIVAPRGRALTCNSADTSLRVQDNRFDCHQPKGIGGAAAVLLSTRLGDVQFSNNYVLSLREDALVAVLMTAGHITFSANHCECRDAPAQGFVHVRLRVAGQGSATAMGNHCLERVMLESALSLALDAAGAGLVAVGNITTNRLQLNPASPATTLANVSGILA